MSRADETETAAEVTRLTRLAESTLRTAIQNIATHPNIAASQIETAIGTNHSIRGFLL